MSQRSGGSIRQQPPTPSPSPLFMPSPLPPPPSVALKGRDVEDWAMWRCIEQHQAHRPNTVRSRSRWTGGVLDQAYLRCGEVTSEYAKTFYLGTQLMTPVQAKAIWAVYVWCRRTDELVDGPNASRITPKVRERGTGPRDTATAQSDCRSVRPAPPRPALRRNVAHP